MNSTSGNSLRKGLLIAFLVILALIMLIPLSFWWSDVYYRQLYAVSPAFQADTLAVFQTIEHPEGVIASDPSIVSTGAGGGSGVGTWLTFEYVLENTTYEEVTAFYNDQLTQDGWDIESEYHYESLDAGVGGLGWGTIGLTQYARRSACMSLDVISYQTTRVGIVVWLDVDDQPYSPWRPPYFMLLIAGLGLGPAGVNNCP